MCCYYFMPEKRHDGLWPRPERLPLGHSFSGHCSVPGYEGEQLTDAELKECNVGYVRCPRLPAERRGDAVRFCISRDAGDSLEVLYVCELNHQPRGHGALEFSRPAAGWLNSHRDERIQCKAESFVQAYLSRR